VQPSDIRAAWRGVERCRSCAIRHLVLFADLQQTDFDSIHQPIDDITPAEGDYLYHQGDQTHSVFTIRSGLVKLTQRLANGDRRIVRLLRQGDVAGLERTQGQAAEHDAIALAGVSACRIPLSVVDKLARDTPNLHRQLLHRWQRALSEADLWITHLSTGKAMVRVARLLLYLQQSCDAPQFYLPGRDDMGAMLGITTESASKAVAELRRGKLLVIVGPHHAHIDIAAVQSVADR
jgi:CRP-like cAMP-binding protein